MEQLNMKLKITLSLILASLLIIYGFTSNAMNDNFGDISPSTIAPASVYKNDEALKAYIKRVTLQGYIPNFDEQIEMEAVSNAYSEIYSEANADKTKFKNLWEGIRDGEGKKGTTVEAVKYQ